MTHRYTSAAQLAEIFNGYAPSRALALSIYWPDPLCFVGRALDISYRSDKQEGGGDGTLANYIHLHETPCALLTGPDRDLPLFPWARHLSPPPGYEFALLGECLDLSFDSPALGEKTLYFYDAGLYPLLGADPSKGMLVIAHPLFDYPLIVWGPKLFVAEQGIVG